MTDIGGPDVWQASFGGEAAAAKRRRGAARHWSDAPAFRDRELRLVPLHPRHTEAWWRQSRDEHLGTMTQLPRFTDERQAHRWIERCWAVTCEPVSFERTQRYTFAIVQSPAGPNLGVDDPQAAGLVGALSLVRKGSSAYFSFWVGVDHQRRGIGTRAALIAQRVAHTHLGLRHLFTASFDHNRPSHRVLLRAGWSMLPFSGEPPSDDLAFFHRALPADSSLPRARSHRLLSTLLRDIGSNFGLAQEPGGASSSDVE